MAIGLGTVLAQRYRADALLGRGGMGEVWRCRDLEQGHDVAIKAVRPEMLSDAGTARLFQSEVVAVARLNHPCIIPVYDLLHDARGGALLVMEFREGRQLGALQDDDPPFSVVREVLVQVLEALAYAHARGVLHLDIKPENVLFERRKKVAAPGGQALRATLLDFGIARVRRPGRGVERWFERDAVIGTVEYMAPEQCTGTFERLGPWSDLFSVGAIAFELCAGRRAFPGAADHDGLVRRLREPPPRLVPMLAGVPAAFPDLCAAMLALDPHDRPASAADVLSALRGLEPEPTPEGAAPPPRARTRVEITTLEEPLPGDEDRVISPSAVTLAFPTASMLAETAVAEAKVATGHGAAPASVAAPLARTAAVPSWRATANTVRPAEAQQAFNAEAAAPPAGAYGLFGLRDLPVLGRQEERLSVWSAVRAAALDRRTRVVLLEGPAGVGKSRLARDAMERAVELGLCAQMQTSWSADGSGDEGLRGLIENLLDTRGAPAHEVHARLDFWLDRAFAEARRHEGEARAGLRGFGGHDAFAREVDLLLRPPRDAAPDAGLPLRVALEAIARAAAVRPVLLWLDDVQWSRGEAAALFGALRGLSPELPVCVIATVRSEEIPDRASYELMAAMAGTDRVLVDKLDLEATRQLVRGLLEVDEELCELLAARAEGNPLFVSLMVRQLVMAEAVGRKDGRYRLTRSFDLSRIPGDIDALLARRIEQSGADRRELAALALVRSRVSLEVAGELSGQRGPALEKAIGKALAGGLLHIEGGAYVWEHGLIRERLVKGIPPLEAPALHAAAAQALVGLVDREDVQEERALHLRAAGLAREAAEALLEAGLWSLRRAEHAPRRARFESLALWAREGSLLDLEARALAELAYAHADIGDVPRAAESLVAAGRLVELGAGTAAASWLALRRSQTVRLQGRVDDGARASEEALEHARKAGVGEVERLALLQLGVDACRRHDHVEARRILDEAAQRSREAADRVTESMALRTLTAVADTGTARGLAERAIELARAAGALRIELVARQVWVDVLWRTGARDEARREAQTLSVEAARRGLRQTVSLLNLQSAAWAALDGHWADARADHAQATKWGAATGAVTERLVLRGLDLVLALSDGDEPNAARAVDALALESGGYDESPFRELMVAAAGMASPPLSARLRAIGKPSAGDP